MRRRMRASRPSYRGKPPRELCVLAWDVRGRPSARIMRTRPSRRWYWTQLRALCAAQGRFVAAAERERGTCPFCLILAARVVEPQRAGLVDFQPGQGFVPQATDVRELVRIAGQAHVRHVIYE